MSIFPDNSSIYITLVGRHVFKTPYRSRVGRAQNTKQIPLFSFLATGINPDVITLTYTHTHDLMAVSPSKVRRYHRHNYIDPNSQPPLHFPPPTLTTVPTRHTSFFDAKSVPTLFVYVESKTEVIYIYHIEIT